MTNALLAAAQTWDMAKKLLTAEQIVARMRVSYPALKAAKVDAGLRQLFLAELLTQAANDGAACIMPENLAMKVVSMDTFNKYREALSGLTDENV